MGIRASDVAMLAHQPAQALALRAHHQHGRTRVKHVGQGVRRRAIQAHGAPSHVLKAFERTREVGLPGVRDLVDGPGSRLGQGAGEGRGMAIL